MRTPNLQYLYLQKPITFVIILCIISLLPGFVLGDFFTQGTSGEAAVASSMLESGNWILPRMNYSPPLAHWLIAAFSYPQGYVSEVTSRLPSAIAFVWLIASVLIFLGKRIKFQQAFIAVLFLLTCVGIHWTGIRAGMDILLSFFIVLGLFRLYKWEDDLHLKGLPVGIPFLLSCAVLTKGAVGIVLPLFVFCVYLLILNKYSLLTVFKSVFYVGVASLFLPLLWYIAAWKQGGSEFLDLVFTSNIGYGKEIWYPLTALLTGFIPWTFLFVFSLFGTKYSKPKKSLTETMKSLWGNFRMLDKVLIFSIVTIFCVLVFWFIPYTNRNVTLVPIYPFIALFLAQYALYFTEYRRLVTRVFAGILVSLMSLLLIAGGLTMVHIIDPLSVVSLFTANEYALDATRLFATAFVSPSWLTVLVLLLNLLTVVVVWYQLFKKINIKILYATIALTFTLNMMMDGIVLFNLK